MDNRQRSRAILKNVGFNLLAEGKTIRIRAHGYSMYPCIRPGAVILIEPLKLKGKPVPGEIIAIKRDSGLIVHRLTRIINQGGTDYYIARGDSNALADNPVRLEKIAGRVTGAELTDGTMSDLKVNNKPAYIANRIRVIWILLLARLTRALRRIR